MQSSSMSKSIFHEEKELAKGWFTNLRNEICNRFEEIESEKNSDKKFSRKSWLRSEGGGGEMSIMYGEIFEKVGVNISEVYGSVPSVLVSQMPGCVLGQDLWASGISVVAHMNSPKVPSVHFNTRMINVGDKLWFGGGSDLTPTFEVDDNTKLFHHAFKDVCDKYDSSYYHSFKQNCDEYFMIKHRNEPRGVGGIFFDYLNTGNWNTDFNFIKDVGTAFLQIFSHLVRINYNYSWSDNDKELQYNKRAKYVEFNLMYDRGTKFGFLTGGNPEAILMSMPPICTWRQKWI